jgi:branched-subunit amino acid aminotransferase/4-amino-4-deoxychorismate lyase
VTEPLVHLNGRLLPASQARLAVYDAGIVQGATVTEMTRTFHRRPWRLGSHLDRLFHSLQYVHIDPGVSREQLAAVAEDLVAHNAPLLDEGDELGIIHFVTAGEYATFAGMSRQTARAGPTVCVHTFALPFERWGGKMRAGTHLVTPSVRQVPAECWSPQIKCRSRMHYFLADQEARRWDPEAAALLLDLPGNVTETSTSNFLIVREGTIVSPPRDRILPGISLAVLIELASKRGIPFAERDFTVETALAADEALTTSTPYCLMPVTRINGTAIGDGRPGPVFCRLLAAWSEEVGLDVGRQIEEQARRRSSRGT